MNARRLAGYIYHHKAVTVLIVCVFVVLVYSLLYWGIVCTNLEAWRHVSNVCELYQEKTAIGILCEPLCNDRRIHSLACESLHSEKEAVFSAYWETTRLVFKASRPSLNADLFDTPIWTDASGYKIYPSEEQFSTMVHDLVQKKLNITLTKQKLQRLVRLRTHKIETDLNKRQLEMENIWALIQENEYILSILFENHEVFPQLIGTCGSFYAVEYVRPIETPRTVLALSDSKTAWAERVKLALMILDLLQEFEEKFPQPVYLCDIKINHFGLPLEGGKLKFLDLDVVNFKSAIDKKISNHKKCDEHEDCDLSDCRSFCSKKKRCEMPVANNNLQIVCEKILLGWSYSRSIILPGLLMSDHTSGTLAALLRQCANPNGNPSESSRAAVPDSLKKRLHNVLREMSKEFSISTSTLQKTHST